MQVSEREFTQKLTTFSKSTMQKISNIANSEEILPKIYQIVMESKTEQEVIEKLNSI